MRSRALPVEPTANSLPPSTWINWMKWNYTRQCDTTLFGLYIITWTLTKHSWIWAQLFNTCAIHYSCPTSNDKNFLKNHAWAPIVAIIIGRRLDCCNYNWQKIGLLTPASAAESLSWGLPPTIQPPYQRVFLLLKISNLKTIFFQFFLKIPVRLINGRWPKTIQENLHLLQRAAVDGVRATSSPSLTTLV